ncbi:low-density lipoprotein receptor-related protein 4 [Patella vulgata]|uniref:low-density lipoprotein receptor-related protein 4 n=1 Tax=Patella vulgata TaxID=6465 RepID=UPI00217F4D92|nr:low-density lipoprotein receptor-related protein 4 [Patella vulgata]
MKTSLYVVLVLLPVYTRSIVFPTQGEDPLIAVLDKDKKVSFINPAGGNNTPVLETIALMSSGRGASSAIDFNYNGKLIYWTDIAAHKVYSVKVDGGDEEQKVVLEGDLDKPEGLAYDWIHNHLYISDRMNDNILVINPDTGARKTLLSHVGYPRDIEVDPRTGWLYLIAGDEESAKLMRTTLDGRYHELITRELDYPIRLALDYDEQRLYWTEGTFNMIKSIGVNGENLTTVYTPYSTWDFTPVDITISGDYLYWVQNMRKLLRIPKHGGSEVTRYENLEQYGRWHIRQHSLMGICAIDPRKQADSPNVCGTNNGGCSHFCLPSLLSSNRSPTCTCPDGLTLTADKATCSV